jgi:hypothetical protein
MADVTINSSDPLTPAQIQNLVNACNTLCQQASADPAEMQAFMQNPYNCLVQCGAQMSWSAEIIAAFNAGAIANAPIVSDETGLRLRSGPNSWQCWSCFLGATTIMWTVILVAGIVIAWSPFSLVIASAVGSLAAALTLSVPVVSGLLSGIGAVSIGVGVNWAANALCNYIPNTCAAPTPYTGPWQNYQSIGGDLTSNQPALVSVAGLPTLYFKGQGSGNLWSRTFDLVSQSWRSHQNLGNFYLSSGPTAYVLNGTVYVAYSESGSLTFQSSGDGVHFNPPLAMTEDRCTFSPGLGELNGSIFAAYVQTTSNQICLSTMSGGNGPQQVLINGATSNAPPSLAWLAGVLYCAYTNGGSLYIASSTDALTWSAPIKLQTSSVQGGPILSTLGGTIMYCCYTGTDQQIRYISAQVVGNALTWVAEEPVHSALSSTGPAFLAQGASLYMANKGKSSNTLYWGITQA